VNPEVSGRKPLFELHFLHHVCPVDCSVPEPVLPLWLLVVHDSNPKVTSAVRKTASSGLVFFITDAQKISYKCEKTVFKTSFLKACSAINDYAVFLPRFIFPSEELCFGLLRHLAEVLRTIIDFSGRQGSTLFFSSSQSSLTSQTVSTIWKKCVEFVWINISYIWIEICEAKCFPSLNTCPLWRVQSIFILPSLKNYPLG